MRGVLHMPARLALYLLLQKPLKTSGKPALVSPCRNLPDCLAVGAVRRKPLCGKFREDPGSSGMGAGLQRAIACFIWSQNRGKNQVKYAPKMALAAAMQRAFQRGEEWGSPGPCKRRPVLERGAHGAGQGHSGGARCWRRTPRSSERGRPSPSIGG